MSTKFFAIGREGQKSISCVNQTAYFQAIVVPSLIRTAALSSPHHVTVTTLHTGEIKIKRQSQPETFIMYIQLQLQKHTSYELFPFRLQG